jgi:hypothetical protein
MQSISGDDDGTAYASHLEYAQLAMPALFGALVTDHG